MNSSKLKILIYRIVEFFLGKKATRKKYLSKCVERFVSANCIFIHIPKAAGTSIAEATIGQRAGHFTASEIKEAMGEKFNRYFSFSVTRHPYKKLKSSYEFIVNNGGDKGGVRWEKDFDLPAFKTFDTFVSDWLVHQDFDTINLLFRPQYEYIYDREGNMLVNHVGKVEALDKLEKDLSDALKKSINIQHINITNSKKASGDDLSEKTKELIYTLYKKDFELFGYEK